jgi:spoIIIJ-associated protein
MAKKKNDIKTVTEISDELFKLLGVDIKTEVSEDKANEAIRVDVDAGDTAGLLIGNRGRTINSLQSIIGIIYMKKTGEWRRILIDIADWREKEEDRLTRMAETAADRAKETGQAQQLYNLTPSQRRIVHTTLSEDKGVETLSEGEGDERYLVVKPKD